MSSATILFILKRLLNKHQEGNGNLKEGIVLGFGPGLSIEGCIFQQVY